MSKSNRIHGVLKDLRGNIFNFPGLVFTRRLFAVLIMFYFLHVSISCSGTHEESNSHTSVETYRSIAGAKYQGNVQYLFNESRSQVICLQSSKPTGLKPHPELDFFIYDISKENILFEDSLINGKVGWINNSQVQVEFIPETISGDEDLNKSGYIYDVNMMQKLSIDPNP